MDFFLVIVGGLTLGWILDRIGATDPQRVILLLRLGDLRLMRMFVLATGTASLLLFGGELLGWVNNARMSILPFHGGVIIGGVMVGMAWGATGYFSATALCGAVAGRKDALIFVLGGLVGTLTFILTYSFWKDLGMVDGVALSVGDIPQAGFASVLSAMPGEVIGLILAIWLIVVAFAMPDALRDD